jgi:hypothetical protein
VEEGVREVSLEQWGLLASLLIGAGALYYAKRAAGISAVQLEVAREEALRYPKLEVTDVSLVDAQEVEDVIRTREAQGLWDKAREKAKEEVETSPSNDPTDLFKRMANHTRGYTLGQMGYEGAYPDLVLTFELKNKGRRSAKEVSGEVTFDRNILEPIEFPRMARAVHRGKVTLEVGTMPPLPSEETVGFRIALLQKRSGKTAAVAVFSTPEGDYLEEPMELDVP